MKTIMKSLVPVSVLLLASCSHIGMKVKTDEFVWINQSDHAVRIVIRDFDPRSTDPLFEGSALKGEKIEGAYIGHRSANYYKFEFNGKEMDIWFDETIKVPYTYKTGNEYYKLSVPVGYPPEYDITQAGLYEKVMIDKGYGYLVTWTYTFTDADYEAAKEWSEKQ